MRALQESLRDLGYWLGKPDSTYGGLTEQAVLAIQKAAGLPRDGIAGPKTLAAVKKGTRPSAGASGSADRVEVNLKSQLLLVVRGGKITMILNTSTASGELYESRGQMVVARTPTGTFTVGRTFDGPETGPLGTLYRPRYFYGGYAVHGAPYIPGYPASHGCARLSNAAMDHIWAEDLMPVGSTVVVR